MKKLLSLLLAIGLLAGTIPARALSEDADCELIPEGDAAAPVYAVLTEISGEFEGLTWELSDERTVTITGFSGEIPEELTIPDAIEDFPVTAIGRYAFNNCIELKRISLPDTLRTIGEYAFRNSGLTDLLIPRSVTSFGWGILFGCKGITEYTFPDYMTRIPEQFLSYCENLQKVSIPEGVREIGYEAFRDCKSLTDAVLPQSVTLLETGVFMSCESLAEMVLPPALEELGMSVFASCDRLKSMVIPAGVTVIADQLFSECYSLETVTVLGEITEIGNRAFQACYSLKDFDIPETVTRIGTDAFFYCFSLTEMVIPEGVSKIWSGTFRYCVNLKEITIPASVTEIEPYSFYYAVSLTDIYFGGSGDQWELIVDPYMNQPLYDAVKHFAVASPTVMNGFSLSLKGQIGINVYLILPPYTYTVSLVYEKDSYPQDYRLYDMTPFNPEQNEYKFTYDSIPAKEMTQTLTVWAVQRSQADQQDHFLHFTHYKTGEDLGRYFICCAADYCNIVLADPGADPRLKDLVKALLNYGQCAQLQFNFDTDDLANPQGYMSEEMRTVAADPSKDAEIPAEASDVGYMYGTLSLKGAVSANLYFSKPVTATDENGNPYTVTQKGSKWVITVENIPAKNLGDKFTVIASYGGKSATIKYCALSYANAVLAQKDTDSNANLKELCKAMILYNKYAKAYFGN